MQEAWYSGRVLLVSLVLTKIGIATRSIHVKDEEKIGEDKG